MQFKVVLGLALVLVASGGELRGQVSGVRGAGSRADSVATTRLGIQPRRDDLRDSIRARLTLPRPAAFEAFGRLSPLRLPASAIAAFQADSLRRVLAARQGRLSAAWLGVRDPRVAPPAIISYAARPVLTPRAPGDTTMAGLPAPPSPEPANQYADLALKLGTRLEAKGEKAQTTPCLSIELTSSFSGCRSPIAPTVDFQFNILSAGVLADRVHVDIDYDSQREFDASNNLSIYYAGKPNEVMQRIEVGNVTFAPPPSRFITGGIPSGNYGVQALGQVGPMHFRAIAAQQKGTLVKDARFTVGDVTEQGQLRDVEDYQIEPRRFFFTVDPIEFGSEYPNIDILDGEQLSRLGAALDRRGIRPAKISVYRLQIGSQPPNPNGPRFTVNGLRAANRGDQPYELLREGVDYYVDPSQLWIALVTQPSLERDRIVIAYTVRGPDGQPVEIPSVGGTPDVSYIPGKTQVANLLYDYSINPGDSAFRREIRSVYRIGGEDVQRNTINARIVAGAAGDQEKPIGGAAQTYLQLFGLAQTTNPAAFDAENRVWPRPSDPNVTTSPSGGSSKVVRDYFVVFPSLQPFSDSGLARPPNLSNAAIYSTPGNYLYSPQHPPSVYRMQLSYQSQGSGDERGTLTLGAIQLRRNSERLSIDGVPLARGLDYTIDYELGRVTFARPDTLFPRPRTVTVQYEENPLFTNAATNIFGLATTFAAPAGEVTFTAISQGQKSQYIRPPLGFEPASSLVAGVTGNWSWDAPLLSSALAKLPMLSERPGESRVMLHAEMATSRPQPNSVGQAWLDSFAGEGGIPISTLDPNWLLSSRPLESRATGSLSFTPNNAASIVWQTNVHLPNDSVPLRFTSRMVDRSIIIQTNSGYSFPESILWLTLQPDTLGFRRQHAGGTTQWITDPMPPATRRWRSIRTVLSPSGADLTRVEQIEFYALVDTRAANAARNPTLVLDLGDVSENTFAVAPESLFVVPNGGGVDSTYRGRQTVGLDRLDTERDSITRSFSAALNDRGIPPDRIDSLFVVSPAGTAKLRDVPLCEAEYGVIQNVGDARTNCTVRNNRLDEEDIDLDYALNYTEAERSSESYFRYVVDLAAASQSPASAPRTACYYSLPVAREDTTDTGPLCWVRIRLPLNAAADTVNSPQLRRIKALRLTMVSGAGVPDEEPTTVPLARFRLRGPLWLKRAEAPLAGIGGDSIATLAGTRGSVRVTTISTRDPGYTPPPGLTNDNDVKTSKQALQTTEVNEQALRVTATNLVPLSRAEAYYRFPEGSKNFLAYRELRVWARGGSPTGWGSRGDLDFFVRMGRDASNFYLYHTPAFSDAWTDVRVDFGVLQSLRARIQNSYLRGGARIGCTAIDSALIAKTNRDALVPDTAVYAACENGYIAYTVAPGVTPPNLAAVQELAVGILRTGSAQLFNPTSDTLDLWVDDIRLRNVEKTPGYAGQVGLEVRAGGIADIRLAASRRDAWFRQLAESPTYVGQDALDLVSTVRLEKLLPASLGLSLPVSIAYSGSSSAPELLDRSDLRASEVQGLRTPRASSASYAISARRITPMENPLIGAILDNVTLNGALATSTARSEYQSGGAKSWSATVDYAVAAEPRATALPSWFTRVLGDLPPWISESELGRAIRGAAFRWNPAQLRFTSGLARSNDDRRTFLKPASAYDDSGRVVSSRSNLWRNNAAIELRPVGPLTLRWDASTTRDLRDYAAGLDTSQLRLDSARLAATRGERGSLFGRDVGLERNRQMTAAASFAPPFSSWLKPRVDIGSTFSFVRDPNARPLSRVDSLTMDSSYVLPRRFGNTQSLTTAAQVDVQAMGRTFWQRLMYLRRLSDAVTPIDVSYSRSLISAFDNEAESPGWGYQLALGGARSFRSLRGHPATTAGLTNTVSAGSSVVFPYGFILVPRYGLTTTRSWYRRTNDQQDVIDGIQRDYPDLTLRWTMAPGAGRAGRIVARAITSLAASAGVRHTRVAALAPSTSSAGDLRVSRIRVYPINATITWPFGDLSATGGYSWSIRDDSLPGSATHGVTGERSADVSRSWALPSRWNTRSPLRTRLGWQEVRTKNVLVESGRSLQDNARRVFSLSADTDLNSTMSFSLQGSRTATMDRNYNRRFVQTVITAAMQLQFFSGTFR
ncbi:MAG TPA: cell surface protein SprA [Gemmatimonadaceae bacterium]|nr:cell surface protein SprA [Gemmatimonadaceae bacterium]